MAKKRNQMQDVVVAAMQWRTQEFFFGGGVFNKFS